MTQTLYDQAVLQHRAGRLGPAEALYRQWLAAHPRDAAALAGLGLLAVQAGQPAAGLPLLDQALALRPDNADALGYRAQALKALGRVAEAAEDLRRALRARPGDAGLLFNLGNALAATGAVEEAAASYRRSLKRAPAQPAALNNLAAALRRLGQGEAAAKAYREAIALAPGDAPLHVNLAVTLGALGDMEGAITSLRQAARLAPDQPEPWHLLGKQLLQARQTEEALAALGRALALGDSPALRTDIAGALAQAKRRPEAVAHLRRACELAPNDAQGWTNLGTLLRDVGDDAGAVAALTEALRLRPGYAPARYHLGVTHLLAERLKEGWPLYEARLAANAGWESRFEVPHWRGEKMPGETLLLHAEQGLGDTLQFCRWVALAKPAAAARAVLEVQPPLLRLLSSLPGVDAVIAAGDALPAFDRHCPLPGLPAVFGATLETLPGPMPYIHADADRVEYWRGRVEARPGRKVGLVWAGNAEFEHDELRSIPPEALGALAGLEGITFISLQKDRGRDAGGKPPLPITVDWTDELTDVAETAALMAALDLIISADTAMVHLAGGLGRPVWLLNRYDTDWRWFRHRTEDSPFYPTLRQFRQQAPGGWEAVMERVRAALTGHHDW